MSKLADELESMARNHIPYDRSALFRACDTLRALRAAEQPSREAVLEEAANVCWNMWKNATNKAPDYEQNSISHGCIACAKAIRALKAQPAEPAAQIARVLPLPPQPETTLTTTAGNGIVYTAAAQAASLEGLSSVQSQHSPAPAAAPSVTPGISIDFIDEHGQQWTRAERYHQLECEAELAAENAELWMKTCREAEDALEVAQADRDKYHSLFDLRTTSYRDIEAKFDHMYILFSGIKHTIINLTSKIEAECDATVPKK